MKSDPHARTDIHGRAMAMAVGREGNGQSAR